MSAAAQHRLLVRPGAGPVRRAPRRAAGRDVGAARHERRREDDAAATGLGARQPSRGVVRLNGEERDVSLAGDPGEVGIDQLPGGNAIFAPMLGAREPGNRPDSSTERTAPIAGARFDRALAIFPDLNGAPRRHGGVVVGWSAADARAGDGVDARPRDPVDRRAVARSRSGDGASRCSRWSTGSRPTGRR